MVVMIILGAMVLARSLFHIDADLVPIFGDAPVIDERMVRLQGKVPDVRHRAKFENWHTIVPVTFNAGAVSAEQIVNLFHIGGFSCGVGELRPQCSGQLGRFRLATAEDMKRLDHQTKKLRAVGSSGG